MAIIYLIFEKILDLATNNFFEAVNTVIFFNNIYVYF